LFEKYYKPFVRHGGTYIFHHLPKKRLSDYLPLVKEFFPRRCSSNPPCHRGISFVSSLGHQITWPTKRRPATTRLRLGTFIIILPFHQPWRVAEDAIAVDLISGGRLDLGVGPGWDLNEFESLGVPIKQRRPRMHEGLEALRRLFTEERVTHNGRELAGFRQ
jgi:hypothetical protein